MLNNLISKKQMRKILRYLIMFSAVFISTQHIPECSVSYETAFIMASIASITFAIIDMYFPVLTDAST